MVLNREYSNEFAQGETVYSVKTMLRLTTVYDPTILYTLD